MNRLEKVHQQQLFRKFSQKQQQTARTCTFLHRRTHAVVGVHIVERHRTVRFVVGGIGGRIEPQPVTDRVACSYYAGDGRGNALARAPVQLTFTVECRKLRNE